MTTLRDSTRGARDCLRALVCAAVAAVVGVVGGACGGTPDPRIATQASANDDALTERAGSLILEALNDASLEHGALSALRSAGAAGLPWVRRALEGQPTPPVAVQAELQAMLVARGDADAVGWLLTNDATDATSVACRLGVMDPETEHATLMAGLHHAGAHVREVALRRLRATLTPPEALELGELARLDPDANVRATAIEALTARQLVDAQWLGQRLDDRDLSVRTLVMRALAELDCAAAREALSDRLLGAPSSDGLAAARAMARCGPEALDVAATAVRRTLASTNAALRAEAATTADRFAWLRVPEWFAQAMTSDPVPAVRLALTLSVALTQPELAQQQLRALAQNDNRMVALQAAVALAEAGDEPALQMVVRARTQQDVVVRRVAFRALGRLVRGGAWLASGLDDADANVRLTAASGLLRATL